MSSGTPSVSLETFAAKLAASQLIPADKWPDIKTNVLAASDAKTAALKLASQGVLSRWQASQLLRGNTSLMLGRYRLIEQIGQSVFGKIYLVEHAQLARKLTLFAFAPRLLKGEVREGLMSKARSAAGLDHASILRVSDIDHEGEQFYFVSPEIAVTDIAGYVAKNGSLSGSKAAAMTAAIAEALAYGAKNQVSHGWLCPSNVVLDAKGRPFVVGFGFADVIAKYPEIESQLVAEATEMERISIPPESEGAIAPSPSVDAYALGQLLFLLATGKSPVRDELGDPDARDQITTANPSVLPAIAELYAELTNADVGQRLTGASLIADRLREIAASDAPTEAAPPPLAASQAVPIIKAKKAKSLPRATSVAKASTVVTEPSLDTDELRLAEVESVSVPSAPLVDLSAPQKKDSSAGEKKASSEPRKDDSHHVRRKKGNSKAALWVTLAAAGSLAMLVGVTGFVLWLVMPPSKPAEVAKNKGSATAPEVSAKNAVASKSDAKQSETPAAADKPKDTSEVTAPANQATPPAAESPSANSEVAPTPDPAMAKPEEPAKPNPSSDTPPTNPDPPAGPSPTPEPTTPAPTNPTPTTEPAPPPMPMPEQGQPGGPLAKLPAIFELAPPSEENVNKPIEMGDLPLASNAFATAMLVGGDAAVKGPYQFSLEDKADNDWNVKLTATKEKTEKVLANLVIADGKLKFTWTSDAAQEPNAVGLRNCVLSLSAAGSPPHKMVLRTPVEFEMISPTEKKLSVSKQIEVANLPSPDRLRLQVVAAKEGMPHADVSFRVKVVGAKSKYIEPKSADELRPSVVWIGSEPRVKPFGFEIKPDLKGKGLAIAVQTIVRGVDDVDKETYANYKPKDVQNFSKNAKARSEFLGSDMLNTKNSQPPEGADAGQFNAAKDEKVKYLTAELANLARAAEWSVDAEKVAPAALKGNSLEFRLYYDAGESMQVELAKSKGFDAAKK